MKFLLKSLAFASIVSCLLWACGGAKTESETGTTDATQNTETPTEQPAASPDDAQIKDGKGIGEVKDVKLTDPLDAEMVKAGTGIYEMKCASCHKLTDQKTVGPGWQGITNRRKPEWIMNMTTNVDKMLDKDPTAQKLLEECMVRMPNQGLSMDDARKILEFMRNNDAEKAGSKDGAVKG